jgi:hypothetical protein
MAQSVDLIHQMHNHTYALGIDAKKAALTGQARPEIAAGGARVYLSLSSPALISASASIDK